HRRKLGAILLQVLGGIARAAVKMELAVGIAGDALVRRKHLIAQAVDVEADGTADGHGSILASVARSSAEDRGQRVADPRALLGRDEIAQHASETRVLHAGDDVLPTV